MSIYEGLEKILDKSNIKYNELMKNHTTTKVGGPCDCLVEPTSIEEIQNILKYAKENNIKYYVIGNGSNLLVKDEGINALIIKITDKFSDYDINDNYIKVKSLWKDKTSEAIYNKLLAMMKAKQKAQIAIKEDYKEQRMLKTDEVAKEVEIDAELAKINKEISEAIKNEQAIQ